MEHFSTAVGLFFLVKMGAHLAQSAGHDDLKAIKHVLLAIFYAIVLIPILISKIMLN